MMKQCIWTCKNLTKDTVALTGRHPQAANRLPPCLWLPTELRGKRVTEIADGAFAGDEEVVAVTVPYGIRKIGRGAFSHCPNLTAVVLSAKVPEIASDAFWRCPRLATLSVPKGMKVRGIAAFSVGWPIPSVPLRNTASGYRYGARYDNRDCYLFRDPSEWTLYGVPDGTTEVYEGAFRGLTRLRRVELPESLESIGKGAFEGCTGLGRVRVPASVEEISPSAFWGTRGVRVASGNRHYASTEEGALIGAGCLLYVPAGVRSLDLPATVSSVGDGAFALCRGIESVTFSTTQSVEFDEHVFEGCHALPVIDGFRYTAADRRVLLNAPEDVIGRIVIPEGVREIGPFAFAERAQLTEAVLPESLRDIADCAFMGCTALERVRFPSALCGLGNCAFSDCRSLQEALLPDSALGLGFEIFSGCLSLKRMRLSSRETFITLSMFSNCRSLEAADIPPGVTTICQQAFEGCTSLTSVRLPSGLRSLEDGAFSGCTSLKEVCVSEAVARHLSADSFGGCTSLPSENGLYFEGPQRRIVLNNDRTATGVCVVPESVRTVADGAFKDAKYTSVTLPKREISVPGILFEGCLNLVHTELSGVRTLALYAFCDCPALEEITLPEGMEVLHSATFTGCSALKSVRFPSTLKRIERHAFEDCPNLVLTEIPPGAEADEPVAPPRPVFSADSADDRKNVCDFSYPADDGDDMPF